VTGLGWFEQATEVSKSPVIRRSSPRSNSRGWSRPRGLRNVYVRRVLVGREPQRQLLGALVERAHDGSAGTLVVRGEPGVGKSALLDELLAGADEATVLRTQGLEVEAPLAFAALHRLLRPLTRLRAFHSTAAAGPVTGRSGRRRRPRRARPS
jgi:hypothetical protein